MHSRTIGRILRLAALFTSTCLLAACGSDSQTSSVPVVSAAAPVASTDPAPPPVPAQSPAQSPAAAVRALDCTVGDTVRRNTSLLITPVGGKVAVVAIGSSSTAGTGASSAATTYPSVLQQLLAARDDLAAFTVYNKGIGGDTLVGTQNRLQRDVFDLSPQLVILQAGTNDAINDQSAAALAAFTDRLRTVVTTIKTHAPVVLMTSQHYPNEPSIYPSYQAAIEQVGQEQSVAVFDRYALMTSWIDSGRYRFADILASDSFHPNDLTYRCMAQVMAELIVTRIGR